MGLLLIFPDFRSVNWLLYTHMKFVARVKSLKGFPYLQAFGGKCHSLWERFCTLVDDHPLCVAFATSLET